MQTSTKETEEVFQRALLCPRYIYTQSHLRTESNGCTCSVKALPCLQTQPTLRIVGEFLASFVVCTDHISFFMLLHWKLILVVLSLGSAPGLRRAHPSLKQERSGKQRPCRGTHHINSAVWPFASSLLGEWQNHRSYLNCAGDSCLPSHQLQMTSDSWWQLYNFCVRWPFHKGHAGAGLREGPRRRLTVCASAGEAVYGSYTQPLN